MTSNGGTFPREDYAVTFRAYIVCDKCGKGHPTGYCSICRSTFYCSEECQRQDGSHWSRCVSPTSNDTLQHKAVEKNTACGICLEDSIVNPTTLPGCDHVFCFACLVTWQGRESFTDPTDADFKFCPLCRKDIEMPVWQIALDKACDYYQQGLRLPKGATGLGGTCQRSQLFHRALNKVETVLGHDYNLSALRLQVSILRHVNPTEAIQLALRVLDQYAEHCSLVNELDQQLQAAETGNVRLARRLDRQITKCYGQFDEWPPYLGEEPHNVLPIRISLAESYEETRQYEKAHLEFSEMLHLGIPHGSDEEMDCLRGGARCAFHLGDYETSLYTAEVALGLDRNLPGGHKLVAQVQRALAQRAPHPTTRVVVGGQARPVPTVTDALHTMWRGMAYETPWGDAVDELDNLSFLHELLVELGRPTSECHP